MKTINTFLILSLLCIPFITGCKDQNNSNEVEKYLPYEIDKTGTINRFYASDSNSVNIDIPATYSIDEDGKIVSGNSYQVTTISDYCFANNNLIKTVNIPDTVTSIGEKAFYNCSNLEKINISSYVTYIGDNAFDNCLKLKKITSINENGLILSENDNLNSFDIPSNITEIGENVLNGWDKLNNLTINEPIKIIDDNSITNNPLLNYVTINIVLDDLGDNVFSECLLLTSLNLTESTSGINILKTQNISKFYIPSSVTTIPSRMFYSWKKLEELYIPESVKYASNIFCDNISLKTIYCGITKFYKLFDYYYPGYSGQDEPNEGMYQSSTIDSLYYFIPKTLKEVHILNGTNLERYCFSGMTSIESVYLPNTMVEFGNEAFYGCTGLKTVYLETDCDWYYSNDSYYVSDSGVISKNDVNNPYKFAEAIKHSNGYLSWRKNIEY